MSLLWAINKHHIFHIYGYTGVVAYGSGNVLSIIPLSRVFFIFYGLAKSQETLQGWTEKITLYDWINWNDLATGFEFYMTTMIVGLLRRCIVFSKQRL